MRATPVVLPVPVVMAALLATVARVVSAVMPSEAEPQALTAMVATAATAERPELPVTEQTAMKETS